MLAVTVVLGGALSEARAQSRCDVTGDGKVTRADVTLLMQVALNKRACPAGRLCDIDGNGKVDVRDVQLLNKVVRGTMCPVKAKAKPPRATTKPPRKGNNTPPRATGKAPPRKAPSDPPALFECRARGMAPSLILLHNGKVKRYDGKSMKTFSSDGWPPRNYPPVIPRLGRASASGSYRVAGNRLTLTIGTASQTSSSTTGDPAFGLVKFVIGSSTCHLVEQTAVTGLASTFNYACEANPALFGGVFDDKHYFRFNKNGGVLWRRNVRVSQMANTYYGVATGVFKMLPNNKIKIIFGNLPTVFVGKAKIRQGHLRTVLTGSTGNNTMTIDQRTVVKSACNPG